MCYLKMLCSVSMRLKAVTNIQKITKSMKMVSAAKYAKAERELRLARPYGVGTKGWLIDLKLTVSHSTFLEKTS